MSSFLQRWSRKKAIDSTHQETASDTRLTKDSTSIDEELTYLHTDLEIDDVSLAIPTNLVAEDSLSDLKDNKQIIDLQSEDTLDASSMSIADLLISKASKDIKKNALRNIFASSEFNLRDGLDDYDDNYNDLVKLSSDIAATLRNWLTDDEKIAKKLDNTLMSDMEDTKQNMEPQTMQEQEGIMLEQYLEKSTSINGKARAYTVQNTVTLKNLIAPQVSYNSKGCLLIVGQLSKIIIAAQKLLSDPNNQLTLTLLATSKEAVTNPNTQLDIYYATKVSVSGFLGAFDVVVEQNEQLVNLAQIALRVDHFDVILDLSNQPLMTEEVAVFGYYSINDEKIVDPHIREQKLNQVINDMSGLVGTFDKPKYFRLNHSLCAHNARGIIGCTSCISACPAGALTTTKISAIESQITINPHLCQGIGTCAMACPTEAISYALPNPQETQQFIENTLNNYHKAGGANAIILFISAEHEKYNVMMLQELPDNVIPIKLEELTSIGIDTWFAALVNGATQVLFAASKRMPATILTILKKEVAIAQSFLMHLGIVKNKIDILYLEDMRNLDLLTKLSTNSLNLNLGKLTGSKRERLFSALDELAKNYPPLNNIQNLPTNLPYGTLKCTADKCTLCMSCIAVCPTKALHNDGIVPVINFIEQDCVQCGLCTKACPENALELVSRLNWDSAQRTQEQILHEGKVAQCLICDKPFAPLSMITMLQDKLKNHSNFSDPKALNRIAMCEDCRVKDIFTPMIDDPTKQLEV